VTECCTVRPATERDLDAMVELLGLLFGQESDFVASPPRQRRGLEAILAAPTCGHLLVATPVSGRASDGEGVIGMVSVLFTISTAEGGPAAWLEDLVVAPSHRGRGVGTALLEAASAVCAERGVLRLTLLTDRDNTAAQRHYARHGFRSSAMLPMRRSLR